MNVEHEQEQKNEPITVHLNIKTRFFVGKKPTRLFMGTDIIPVNSWRKVARILLKRCSYEKHKELLDARNKSFGNKRIILSDTGIGMEMPNKIDKDIFFEMHFSTDKLLSMLFHIFDDIGYDYKDFTVTVKARQPTVHKEK